MAYKISLHVKAQEDLKKIDKIIVKRIIQKLQWLEQQENPFHYAKRLLEPAAGDIRFRIGEYRVIAIVQEQLKSIIIVKIGHRKDIYR